MLIESRVGHEPDSAWRSVAAEFVAAHHEAIVARASRRAAARGTFAKDEPARSPRCSALLARISEGLAANGGAPPDETSAIADAARVHAGQCNRSGLDVAEVVRLYGDISDAIADLAVDLPIDPTHMRAFRLLNQCIEACLVVAVREYERCRDVERVAANGGRFIAWAHEFDITLTTAISSFDFMQRGAVGMNGSAGRIHARTLSRMRTLLIDSLLSLE